MCGIYGFVGNNAFNEVLKGIKRLEYRGYDSSGIAFLSENLVGNISTNNLFKLNNGFYTIKELGEINKLEKLIHNLNLASTISIGHTRWATHGKPSVKNAHPHFSEDGNWIVVHNGIIENFFELKQGLKNTRFFSETDSEVFAQLLQKHNCGSTLETVIKACKLIKGSFAFAIINCNEPDKIYIAKKNSPVIIGLGKDCGVVCSDINSIKNAKKIYLLNNNEFAVLEKDKVTLYNENLQKIPLKQIKKIEKTTDDNLGNFKHYMLKEIYEIPKAIKQTVAKYSTFDKIKKALPKSLVKNTKNILIVACGTAYHAGLIGKKILEEQNNIKTEVEIASEFRYNKYIPNKKTLAIFVSQSGETADTIKAVGISKTYGLKTVAITNVKNSSICFETDYCLYTLAGLEIGVASTKAYNSQVAMFYLLSAYINAVNNENEGLVFEEGNKLIKISDEIKNNDVNDVCLNIACDIKDSKNLYMIGRGLDYCLALESSLKLKEISYIHCEAYPAGELKHGTISLIDNSSFVFAFITQDMIKEKTLSNISEVISRGGKVILFSNFIVCNNQLHRFIKLPSIEEKYLPLLTVVYMQLIAYHTSLLVGNNPDKPRSLAKSVTVE